MATPIAVTGRRLYVRAGRGGHSYHSFATSAGAVDVHVGATVDENFRWAVREPSVAPAATEGEFLMF